MSNENCSKPMTFSEFRGAAWICILTIASIGGIFYCASVAMLDDSDPPAASHNDNADVIKAKIDAWETARAYKEPGQKIWLHPGVFARTGIGVSVALFVCVIGLVIWIFNR